MNELVSAALEVADSVVLFEGVVDWVGVDDQLAVLRQWRRAHVAVVVDAVHTEAEVEVDVSIVERARLEGAPPPTRLLRRRRISADHEALETGCELWYWKL